MNSMSEIFHTKALQQAVGGLKNFEAALKQHIEADFEKVKTELTDCITHFKAEIERLKLLVHPAVATLVEAGAPAEQAIAQVAQTTTAANEPKIIT